MKPLEEPPCPVIEVGPADKSLALQVWRELAGATKARNLFTTLLSKAVGLTWWIKWEGDRIIVKRQILPPVGSAFGANHSSSLPTLGSPIVIVDGEKACADIEPEQQSEMDDLAYLMAKVAKSLNWRQSLVHSSERFRERFNAYALHESDFYTWTERVAHQLRKRGKDEIDFESVAEELEDLGRNEARALESHLRVLISHLLKWRYQSSGQGKSWRLTIENQRDDVTELLDESPGLTSKLPTLFQAAYKKARRDAAIETGLEIENFPADPPWELAQIINQSFWPNS